MPHPQSTIHMAPQLSYMIWFTQRTGSTALCDMLETTGVAGVPHEWLNQPGDLLESYDVDSATALREKLWELGTGKNGTFGVKFGMNEPHHSRLLELFRQIPGAPPPSVPRAELWNFVFPNCRHIFMTRRNKVRLAVSWWKAIKSEEWHRRAGEKQDPADVRDQYHFDAINHLMTESVMRESGIQEIFAEGGIIPLTIPYEDFVADYAGTLAQVLRFLGLYADPQALPGKPVFEKLADEVSEEWVQRFRTERQRGWTNLGW